MILEEAFIEISNYLRYNYIDSYTNKTNSSNDIISDADIYCNNVIKKNIKKINYNIIGFISEENKDIFFFDVIKKTKKNYIIAFDPLDGSSNVSSNINSGSIYIIYEYDYIKNCFSNIIKAGYCLYGPSTILVETFDNEVKMYILNNKNNFEYVKDIVFKNNTNNKIYSINSSNEYNNDINNLIRLYKQNNYKQRWIGTMVADCHRILLNDGIFIYPGSSRNKNGKIRLFYEALPFAYIFHLAGGIGINDGYQNILESCNLYDINFIHTKIGIILCSKKEYENLNNILDLLEDKN
tara:strand:- start:1472 stop:2356 length:885 start_codon:yes stop_codon:yes gene_type:complete